MSYSPIRLQRERGKCSGHHEHRKLRAIKMQSLWPESSTSRLSAFKDFDTPKPGKRHMSSPVMGSNDGPELNN